MNVKQLQAFRDRETHQFAVNGRGLSRRRFMRTAGGIAAGAAVGGKLLRPWTVYAAGDDPLPLPAGSLGPFRVFAPYRLDDPNLQLDPPDAEPATITNFNGVVGLAYLDTTVKRTKISTGETVELPSSFSDMRFMSGVYRGVDAKPRQGTFALI